MITLENSTKETLALAAIEQSGSIIKGAAGVTPYECAETAGMAYGVIEGGAEALAAAPAIAAELTAKLIANVSAHASEELAKTVVEIAMPPSLDEIVSKSSEKMSKYLQKPGEIMEELTTDVEDKHKKDAEDKQKEAVNEKKNQHKEKVEKLKAGVNKVKDTIQDKCKNISKYITQGPEWAEKNINELEAKAFKEIDDLIQDNSKKILEDKEKFIDSMADGIAKRGADIINKANKSALKKNLDKINAAKQKVLNKAKSKVGKALLNVMASLGL